MQDYSELCCIVGLMLLYIGYINKMDVDAIKLPAWEGHSVQWQRSQFCFGFWLTGQFRPDRTLELKIRKEIFTDP